MKKRLFVIIPFLLAFMLNFVVYTPVSAYVTTSSLIFTPSNSSSYNFTASTDGCLIIVDFVTTSVERSYMDLSEQPLSLHSFKSGTWQGSDVSNLSSSLLCDQSDTVGFSHTVSIVSSGEYFVYMVQICLPVVSGDSFTLNRNFSSFCTEKSYYTNYSFYPACSGVRKCYIKSGLTPDSSYSFELPSDNQFIFYIFSSDKFSSKTYCGNLNRTSIVNVSNFSDCSFIASNQWCDYFTSNYGLSSGSSISFSLVDDLTAFCIVGYELYFDGHSFPGLDDSTHMGDDDSVSGSGSTDLSGVTSRLDEIIYLLESGGTGFSPEEFWAVYKSGLEEMFGLEAAEPTEPPPEDTTEETTEATTSPFDVGIDEEQVDEAMSYVSTDLGDNISGSGGAIAFFWFITDKFLTTCNLYTVVGLSLVFCLGTWLLRS